MDAPAGLVGLGAGHHAEGDLARTQRRDACFARELLAIGRQDRGDGDEILLLDVGVAQRELEGGEPVAMDADAAGEEEAGRDGKHPVVPFAWPYSFPAPLNFVNARASFG